MDVEKLKLITSIISKGDTSSAEVLFDKPGGKKYLESLVLVMVSSLPCLQDEKEDLFLAFLQGLNTIEKRIKRQKEGHKILRQVYNP